MLESILDRCRRHSVAVRHLLLGKQWYVALEAMEFASGFHKGTRKDKITPEFSHQIEIAGLLLTLSDALLYPEETIAVSFLHDCPEDYDIGFEELEVKFGARIAKSTRLLTKTFRGKKINPDTYFGDMAEDPIASLVKGADRIHNQSTIVEVFSQEKQNAYIEETKTYILPMLKSARKICPKQFNAYMNIMFILNSQINLIKQINKSWGCP